MVRALVPLLLALTTLSSGTALRDVALPPAAAQGAGASGTAPRESPLPVRDGSVKFAVMGDTGTGDSEQHEVAERLIEARERFPFEFVIMMGDNLYGSEGPSAYVEKFEQPYKPLLDAGVRFYASLGNHDEPAQRFYEPFNMGGERYYTFSRGRVDFFVLDSTYMRPQQLEWLEKALAGSTADWKVSYMHHPMYSSGRKHGSELDLQVLVEPLFLEHGVDVVFAGHEHFYERLKPQNGIFYITQGGSAKLREGNIRAGSPLTAAGFDTDRSFTLVEIAGDRMYVETVSRLGAIVDAAVIPRREISVVATQ